MHAYPDVLEDRVVEGSGLDPAIRAADENVGGPVIETRCVSQLEAARYASYDIADAGPQRAAEKTSPLRPPGIFHRPSHFRGYKVGDLVLETLEFIVGKREVVRVGANSQSGCRCLDLFLSGRFDVLLL